MHFFVRLRATTFFCCFCYAQVCYSIEQRIAIIKLRYRYHDENYTQIMHRYNLDPISHTHPMLKAEEVKRIVEKFEETGSVHDRPQTGRTKPATGENMSPSIMAAIQVNPHIPIQLAWNLEFGKVL